jgi:hypothetical protein
VIVRRDQCRLRARQRGSVFYDTDVARAPQEFFVIPRSAAAGLASDDQVEAVGMLVPSSSKDTLRPSGP